MNTVDEKKCAMGKKIAVFIMAYNEEDAIGRVVRLAKKHGRVFVIDDGSKDKTASIAKSAGAKVIRHAKNLGYGAAVKTALKEARKQKADVFVFMDGDGQHDPTEIPALAKPILDGKADVCQGSRFLGRFVFSPFGRKAGVALINKLTSLCNKTPNVDSQCGFRAISKRAAHLISIHSNGYSGGYEVICSAHFRGLRIVEVPVCVKYFKNRKLPIAQGLELVASLIARAWQRKKEFYDG